MRKQRPIFIETVIRWKLSASWMKFSIIWICIFIYGGNHCESTTMFVKINSNNHDSDNDKSKQSNKEIKIIIMKKKVQQSNQVQSIWIMQRNAICLDLWLTVQQSFFLLLLIYYYFHLLTMTIISLSSSLVFKRT